MKYLRDATYVVGGYVVRGGRVLLLWHGGLSRWVPDRWPDRAGVGGVPA